MKKEIKNWKIYEKIGEGGFSEVYRAVNNNGDVCAVKYISLPKNDEEIRFLFTEGYIRSEDDINIYYLHIIENIKKEIEIMKNLDNNDHIIKYYDFFQESKKEENGYDIYIFMEYATDILKYFSEKEVTITDVIKLGSDICKALEYCSSKNIIHNDIKPSNIFIDEKSNYKLGDFGIATSNNNLNGFGTLDYISPEVYNGENPNTTSDIYSLGLVMYKLINGNLPFVSFDIDEKKAFDIRMSGKKIPNIDGISNEIMSILTKACSFNHNNRYDSANKMRKDLEKIKIYSNTSKKINFSSDLASVTIGIYDNDAIKNNDIKDSYFDLIKNSSIAIKIRNFFAENFVLKIVMLFLIICLLFLLILKGYFSLKKCDSGYINKNGTCVKGYYYCENGYTLNDDNKCQKTIDSVDAKITYTCKDGYTVSGDICVSDDIRDSKFVYKCADGFKLKDTKCEKVESADAVVVYSCPKGYISSGNQCFTISNISAEVKYSCPDSSYNLSGTNCIKNRPSIVAASIKYSCSSGTLKGQTCEHTASPYYYWCAQGRYDYTDGLCHYTTFANKTYYCSQGTSDGKGNCVISSNTTIAATKKYICPSGYIAVNNQCAKTTGIAATSKYICTDDTVLKGTKCYATITTDAVGMYVCEEGFVASGTKCYKNSFPKAIKKYTCSKVYTLNGEKCEKYEFSPAKAHYDE